MKIYVDSSEVVAKKWAAMPVRAKKVVTKNGVEGSITSGRDRTYTYLKDASGQVFYIPLALTPESVVDFVADGALPPPPKVPWPLPETLATNPTAPPAAPLREAPGRQVLHLPVGKDSARRARKGK